MQTYKPKQKLSLRDKNREWKDQCLYYFNSFTKTDYIPTLNLYKIASGKIDESSYRYLTNQFGLKGKVFKNQPAKLINYDFISPIFKRLKAEGRLRGFEPIAYCKNSNYENEKTLLEKNLIVDSLQQRFINALVKNGTFQPVEGQQPPMSPDAINAQISTLKDIKSIVAQNTLDYIIDEQMLFDKYLNQLYDLFVTNKCCSFKTVRRNQVLYYRVHPATFIYKGSDTLKYYEDADFVKTVYYFTLGEVLDIFQDEFEKPEYREKYGDIVSSLELKYNNKRTSSLNSDLDNNWFAEYNRNFNNIEDYLKRDERVGAIQVNHTQFTSFKKVAYIQNGDEEVLIDETYIYDDREQLLNWFWVEETREGYVIDNKYYIGGDEIEFERRSKVNPYKTKKQYNGFTFMDDIIQQKTIPDLLAGFQETYNALKYKLQFMINKNKDKFVTMPIGLLSNVYKDSGDRNSEINNTAYDDNSHNNANIEDDDSYIAKALYYADATQLLFIDETSDNAALALQGLKSIDLSLGNYIEMLMNYMISVKEEAENLIGFNRFRNANINSSDSIGNVQQGISSGTLITEEYFSEFESYLNKDLQGIMDLAKYAYRDGYSTSFTRNNEEIVSLEIDDDFIYSDIGIFVTNGKKRRDLRDTLLQQATQFLQNGMKHSTFMKMMEGSKNFASIIRDVEKAENELLEQQQQQQEADRQNALQIQQLELQNNEEERALKKYEIDSKAETALNNQLNSLISLNMATGHDDVAQKIEDSRTKLIAELQKNNIAREKNMIDMEKAKMDNETKKYVVDKQVTIAKTNK